MDNADDRAIDQWEILITPFPIGPDILMMVSFKSREHPFKFHHCSCKTLYEAQQVRKRLMTDMESMRNEKFMEKYRIGYDLRGSIL
jgi:hypothetical protein